MTECHVEGALVTDASLDRSGEADGWATDADLRWSADWLPPVPDDVDLVTEVSTLMSVFAAERLERIDGLRMRALADASRYGGGVAEIVERSVRLELAAALRITEHAADVLLRMADALVHRYPAALASLAGARITEQHARILAELLDAAQSDVRHRLRTRAVELAEELPVGAFRRALRRLIETEESATLTTRHQHALRSRRVIIEPATDGMAWLHALLPAVEAHAIHGRLTAIAKTLTGRGAPDPHPDPGVVDEEAAARTLDQTRADVLGDLLIDGSCLEHPGEARGIRASVAVTVPALALLEADDADRHSRGLAPATVEGIGPIPLSVAQELCGGDDRWMRVLTHPETGMVLSVGRTQYRPPPALRKLIRWRAERCMAPGCHVPADRCEIDHNIAWNEGGITSLHNHAPLCTGHHTIKHHGNWQVQHLAHEGGALEWTSPTGRRYLVRPERPTPVFRPSAADDGRGTGAPF